MFKPTDLTLQDYLKETQSDKVIPLLTIHDEVNLSVNLKLIKPILKKLITLGMGKQIFDKFGIRYANFLFDAEYTTKGYFTGEGFQDVDDYSPYQLPKDREEHEAYKRYYKAVDSLKTTETKQKDTITILVTDYLKSNLQKKIKRYHSTNDIGFTLILQEKQGLKVTKSYKYQHFLKNSFKKHLKGIEKNE